MSYFYPGVERRISVPDETTLLVVNVGGKQFRAIRIEESLDVGSAGRLTYRVKISGPMQTYEGADHKTAFGSVAFWREGRRDNIHSIPETLRHHLVGEGALRALLPAETKEQDL